MVYFPHFLVHFIMKPGTPGRFSVHDILAAIYVTHMHAYFAKRKEIITPQFLAIFMLGQPFSVYSPVVAF